jgi:hypothetical protein
MIKLVLSFIKARSIVNRTQIHWSLFMYHRKLVLLIVCLTASGCIEQSSGVPQKTAPIHPRQPRPDTNLDTVTDLNKLYQDMQRAIGEKDLDTGRFISEWRGWSCKIEGVKRKPIKIRDYQAQHLLNILQNADRDYYYGATSDSHLGPPPDCIVAFEKQGSKTVRYYLWHTETPFTIEVSVGDVQIRRHFFGDLELKNKIQSVLGSIAR